MKPLFSVFSIHTISFPKRQGSICTSTIWYVVPQTIIAMKAHLCYCDPTHSTVVCQPYKIRVVCDTIECLNFLPEMPLKSIHLTPCQTANHLRLSFLARNAMSILDSNLALPSVLTEDRCLIVAVTCDLGCATISMISAPPIYH